MPACRCWNEGQWGRVHREDCPVHGVRRHYIGDGCDSLSDDDPLLREHGLAALASLAEALDKGRPTQ